MLAVISPAKTLDFESACPAHTPSQPDFLDEAETLVGVLRKKSRPQLRELMSLSDKLADLNFQRYRSWSRPFSEDNARAALLAFKGDVYTGFELETYGRRDFDFAQKHLRILSGLYGLLRPLDLIQPYRLEMGTRLGNPRGKDLYDFWGDTITGAVNRAVAESGSKVLVNLASNEYFKSVHQEEIEARVITPVFKDLKNDSYKIISFYAKKARGMMCDYLIQNRVKKPDDLKNFDTAGYGYNEELSKEDSWVFTRDEPANR